MSKRKETSDSEIRDLWDKSLNASEVAEALGISRRTASRWLRSVGIEPIRSKYHRTRNPDHGAVASWIRSHKGQTLPRSIKEISNIIGTTQEAVRAYLRRRSLQTLEAESKKVKDLLNQNTVLKDKNGKGFHTRAVDTINISVDMFTSHGKITITLKTGSVRYL